MKQKVRATRDLQKIKLVGREIGPLSSGQEAEFEPWEVAVLEHHYFVKPIQELTIAELRKLSLEEERSTRLGPLPPNFYEMIRQTIRRLRKAGQSDLAGEFQAEVEALTEIRIRKLVLASLSPADAKNLLPEEQFLVNRLAVALKDWEQWLGELFEKEVENGAMMR
jgi:hypothetical protein